MVRISVLGDTLKAINNAEKKGKRQVLVRPSSKVVIKFLQVMQKHGTRGSVTGTFWASLIWAILEKGYIGEFEVVDDRRAGKIVIQLLGRLNKCSVISPRYDLEVRLVLILNRRFECSSHRPPCSSTTWRSGSRTCCRRASSASLS